jgi:predicted GIY-YIG superfamily endonuclease
MTEENYSVYWIKRKQHISYNEGYIGVSKNPEKRFKGHLKNPQNKHLKNAILKYNDIILEIIVHSQTKEFCLLLEEEFRPEKNIGWNIAKGGGNPPNCAGRIVSKESIDKMVNTRKTNNKPSPLIGKPSWNTGITGIFKHTEETKIKMRKPKPEGFGENISNSLKNYTKTEEHLRNISISLKKRNLDIKEGRIKRKPYKKKAINNVCD